MFHWECLTSTHLILLRHPVPVQIAPRGFVHRVGIAQVGRGEVVVERRDGILLGTPAVAEAVPELEDGEDELALSGAAFLDTGAEGRLFDVGGVGSRSPEVLDGFSFVLLDAPAVSCQVREASVTRGQQMGSVGWMGSYRSARP